MPQFRGVLIEEFHLHCTLKQPLSQLVCLTVCGGLLVVIESLCHGEEVASDLIVVWAELGQLHKLSTGHPRIVDSAV